MQTRPSHLVFPLFLVIRVTGVLTLPSDCHQIKVILSAVTPCIIGSLLGPVTVFPRLSEFVLLLVSVIIWFYERGLSALTTTPNLEEQVTTLSLVSTLQPFQYECVYLESKTPANIALWVTETRKPLHHGVNSD